MHKRGLSGGQVSMCIAQRSGAARTARSGDRGPS
jgi:hypothetical protein